MSASRQAYNMALSQNLVLAEVTLNTIEHKPWIQSRILKAKKHCHGNCESSCIAPFYRLGFSSCSCRKCEERLDNGVFEPDAGC